MRRESKKLQCLILNADYLPMKSIRWKKALLLVYKGVVSPIEYYEDFIRDSKGRQHMLPAVIVLHKWVRQNFIVKFNRKNVFLRDKMVCQYCNQIFQPEQLTYDHVIPRSKFRNKNKQTCWFNIVTCCYPCNTKKANRTPKECKMYPINKPREPSYHDILPGITPWSQEIPKEWDLWLSSIIRKHE